MGMRGRWKAFFFALLGALFFALFFVLLLALAFHFYAGYKAQEELFSLAKRHFEAGVHASNPAEKSEAFNQAVEVLLEMPKSSASDAALGIALAELREFPFSIYHLRKALLADPSNEILQRQLIEVTKRAALPFSPLPKAPPPAILGAALALLFLLFMALLIWRPRRLFSIVLSVLSLPLAVFFSWSLYENFFQPIQAVLVRASDFYEGPAPDFPLALREPLPAGLTLFVLESAKEGEWFKVRLSSGIIGYLPSPAIRVLH